MDVFIFPKRFSIFVLSRFSWPAIKLSALRVAKCLVRFEEKCSFVEDITDQNSPFETCQVRRRN